jgi:hypothetical protein
MTKSRKRREAEQRKAQALLDAQPKPQGEWNFLDLKQIGWRPDERDGTKPKIVHIPCESGRTIRHRAPGNGKVVTVLRKISFPCSRLILKHSISGTLVRLTHSQITRKCQDHHSNCPNCGGTKQVTTKGFSVVPVEWCEVSEQYVPVGQIKRLGPALFASYVTERFKLTGIPELLEAMATLPSEDY